MTKRIFNPTLPVLGKLLPPPTEEDLQGVVSFKYADFDYAYRECGSDYVRHVLESAPIQGNHKRVLVDIKIHDLKHGEYPCVPGWHLDGSANIRDLPKRPEIFSLFVTGDHARTEFLRRPIELGVKEE